MEPQVESGDLPLALFAFPQRASQFLLVDIGPGNQAKAPSGTGGLFLGVPGGDAAEPTPSLRRR
jgi:hypothetical protein